MCTTVTVQLGTGWANNNKMETQLIYLNQRISDITSELALVTAIRENLLNGYKDQLASLAPLQAERDTLAQDKADLTIDRDALLRDKETLLATIDAFNKR